jgi:hypothetical protein
MIKKLISMHVKPSLSHHAKEKVSMDDLSEEEFMRVKKAEPFFRERVKRRKIQAKLPITQYSIINISILQILIDS